jgi:hypothetical protein
MNTTKQTFSHGPLQQLKHYYTYPSLTSGSDTPPVKRILVFSNCESLNYCYPKADNKLTHEISHKPESNTPMAGLKFAPSEKLLHSNCQMSDFNQFLETLAITMVSTEHSSLKSSVRHRLDKEF